MAQLLRFVKFSRPVFKRQFRTQFSERGHRSVPKLYKHRWLLTTSNVSPYSLLNCHIGAVVGCGGVEFAGWCVMGFVIEMEK